MKRFAFWIFLGAIMLIVLAFSCSPEDELIKEGCTAEATVRDLSGLDGCGYVFELNDGTRLIAMWEFGWCGTPPLPPEVTDDPLYNFEFVDGKKVLIGYEGRSDWATACMAGHPVKITCLQEITVEER